MLVEVCRQPVCERCTDFFKTSLNGQPEGLEKNGGGFGLRFVYTAIGKERSIKKSDLERGEACCQGGPVYAACMWRCAPYVASVCYNLHAGTSA